MWLRTITLLVSSFGAGIWAQDDYTALLQPSDVCLTYVDCGFTDVTPEVKTNQKYRILPTPSADNVLYIGGLEEFIRVDPACSSSESDPWIKKPKYPIQSCTGGEGETGLPCSTLVSTNPTLKCENYIRAVEKISADSTADKLLVCGTSQSFPRCYIFAFVHNTCDLEVFGEGAVDTFNGVRECSEETESINANDPYDLVPRNFDGNTTIAFYDSKLYFGSSEDIIPGASFVKRLDIAVGTIGTNADDPFSNQLKTYDEETLSVNDANFVGRPYEYSKDGSDYILFFYRETAVEHINQGKIIYSRVARVCKNDAGSSGRWNSYIKARLNCSQPGLYPDYFDEIQDFSVTSEEGGETYFYVIFNRPPSGPPQSAMCIYTLTDIHNVFQTSKFKSQATTNSLWLPVTADVPDPRPGADCGNPTNMPDFLKANPLMNDLVENMNYKTDGQVADDSDHPLFISDGVRYSRVIVDARGTSTLTDDVIFIGTDAGEVWKVTDSSDGCDPAVKACFESFLYWRSATGSPITGLGLITDNSKSYLYATTHEQIIKIDLQYGEAQSQTQFDFIYPPYLTEGSFTSVSSATCSDSIEQTICNGEEVQLTCRGCFDPALNINADTKWMFTPAGGSEIDITASGLGHFIIFNKIRSDAPNPLSYLSVTMHADTSGSYKCVITVGGVDQDSITSTLTAADCTTSTYMTNQGTDFNSAVSDAEANKAQYNMDNEGTVKIECASCDTCPWNNP